MTSRLCKHHKYSAYWAGLVLILSVIACSFDLGSKASSPDETEIARSVDETLIAESSLTESARQAKESPVPAASETSGLNINETLQVQQATIDAQATILAQASPTSSTVEALPSATVEPPVNAAEPIRLTEWKTQNMRQAPGCGENKNGPPCWYGRGDTLELVLEQPILIDPAWESPYLVFSHRYVFVQNATIFIKSENQWKVLWSFVSGRSAVWLPFHVDLSPYKGEDITLQFIVSGTTGGQSGVVKQNEWYILDPKIDPSFNPYQ